MAFFDHHFVLFRTHHDITEDTDPDLEDEYAAARTIFGEPFISPFRSQVPAGVTVVCRYSCLPNYAELEAELAFLGASMINSYDEHRYIAEMRWIDDIAHLTPKTWFNVGYANVPDTEHGWVLKGKTNSRKWQWNTHMFANTRKGLESVYRRLIDDTYIAPQGIVIREYVPLKPIEQAINGLPITNEWRCFFYKDLLLSGGYYWSIAESVDEHTVMPEPARKVAQAAADLLCKHTNFFVVDVAETVKGEWIVIEVNDGQMSGLSENDPVTLYTALREAI